MLCHLARNAFESINRHNTGDNSKRCCFRAGEPGIGREPLVREPIDPVAQTEAKPV
jgi:hypothetical protein